MIVCAFCRHHVLQCSMEALSISSSVLARNASGVCYKITCNILNACTVALMIHIEVELECTWPAPVNCVGQTTQTARSSGVVKAHKLQPQDYCSYERTEGEDVSDDMASDSSLSTACCSSWPTVTLPNDLSSSDRAFKTLDEFSPSGFSGGFAWCV
jgi:hypothetical protein